MKGYSKNHHAYVVDVSGTALNEAIGYISEHVKREYEGYIPTHVHFLFDTLLIEHVGDIVSLQKKKSGHNEHRFIFIGFNSATREAQNALLKALEEPSARTSFFILVPATHILLETVTSRCLFLTVEAEVKEEPSFIAMGYRERLEYVQKLLEHKDRLAPFFTQLEKDISLLAAKDVHKKEMRTLLIPLRYKRAILSQSSVAKYLLEEKALTLPIIQ